LAIDDKNNICISTNDKFYIYDLESKMINSWKLDIGQDNRCYKKMAFNKNEIFVV
jgi:hypothetical protein